MPECEPIRKYGLDWPYDWSDLHIEFHCIAQGGKWTQDNEIVGAGLFEHYRNAQRLLWPEDDEHRWAMLGLQTIVDNEVSVFCGASDTSKTYTISKFVMVDWWAHPDNTLWMVSSTELRGAELKSWGTLKQLFNRARKLYPWLPGSVLESKHCITTEEISDDRRTARLLTKGIIFIPCKSNGRWVGMGCFPTGQLVDTPNGKRPIEDIQAGDLILNCLGASRVKRTSVRTAKQLVRITLEDGRSMDCTPEHPILTGMGWVNAIDIPPSQRVFSAGETMQILQGEDVGIQTLPAPLLFPQVRTRLSIQNVRMVSETLRSIGCQESFLRSLLRSEMEGIPTGDSQTNGRWPRLENTRSQGECRDSGQPERTQAAKRVDETIAAEHEAESALQQEWAWSRQHSSSGTHLVGHLPEGYPQFPDSHRTFLETGKPAAVPFGPSVATHPAGCRSRWANPFERRSEAEGCKTDSIPSGTRVDRVEILELGSDARYDRSAGGYRVHNLEVEGHPSYCVNGVLVHNSYAGVKGGSLNARLGHFGDEVSAMERTFLDAYANWYGKANFRGIMSGNPYDLEDCLCVAAEPVDGWGSWKDTEKTQTWRSKFYDAAVVAFDGRDSPNLDVPETAPTPFKYLIGRRKLKAVARYHGTDSWQYASQCTGKPRPGAMLRRVITRQLCEEFLAFDDVVWAGKPTIKIAACDAAYGGVGGDDCILGHIEYGEDVDGRTIIACNPPVVVPVSVKKKNLPEQQIATFCKEYCEANEIPADNFFFDARSTMAITFARIWSANVNVVDFGAPPTDRPVSLDTFIWDGDTQQRRLQRCNELYSKFVTELWYTIHYIILSKQMRRLPKEVAEEGYKREWRYAKGGRIEVETKADMKQRTGHSPDRFDWLVTAVEGARRRGFEIKRMAAEKDEQENDNWLEKEVRKHREFLKKSELRYA